MFPLIEQLGVAALFAVAIDDGVSGDGVKQGAVWPLLTVFFQIPRKAFLQDVARKIVIPRASQQVCKKPVPVLLVEYSEITHFSIKTNNRLKGYRLIVQISIGSYYNWFQNLRSRSKIRRRRIRWGFDTTYRKDGVPVWSCG